MSGAAEDFWWLNGSDGGQSVGGRAVVSRSSFLPPSVHYGVETRSGRPMDWTGRPANTDVNCIPSRGKSQFCLESAMSEGEGRARFFREQSSRSLARRPPWSDAAGNASHFRCLRLRRPTTRVSSIISRRGGIREFGLEHRWN